jgi:hypothetical protein
VTITITHNKTVGNPNLDTIKKTYRSRNCLPFENKYVHLGSVSRTHMFTLGPCREYICSPWVRVANFLLCCVSCFVLLTFVLCLVCLMLPSVFSDVYLEQKNKPKIHKTIAKAIKDYISVGRNQNNKRK